MYPERTAKRVIDGDNIDYVILTDMPTPQNILGIVQEISDLLGNQEVIAYGGCLREEASNFFNNIKIPFSDIDIAIDVRDGIITKSKSEGQPLIDKLINTIMDNPDIFKDARVYYEAPGKRSRIKATFISQDGEEFPMDIGLIHGDVTQENYAKFADAPINGFAMGKDGLIYAHEHAEDDIKDGRFDVQVKSDGDIRQSVERFFKLKQRYPDLRLYINEKPVASASNDFQNAAQGVSTVLRELDIKDKRKP